MSDAPDRDPAVASLAHPATLAFLARRVWVSLVLRPGAAPRVAYDPAALLRDPAVTWIGHATCLVRMDGVSFLIDPMFGPRASPLPFAGPPRRVPPGVPLAELPRLDFATLSHDHFDHADLPSIRSLAALGVPFVVPTGLGELVQRAGAQVAAELGWWQSAEVAGVRVTCVPSRHFSGRGLRDRNRRLWGGFVVEGRTRRFYHPGDTAFFGGFAEIRRRLGPPDLAALPIGAYLPVEIMQSVHLNPEEAIEAALALEARHTVATHWGTFDLTDEPLDEPPVRFLAAAQQRGLAGRAHVLAVGETRGF